jgi:predicted nucleic acid-binding protein
VLADYLEAVDLVEPLSLPRIVPEDADDDQVIAAAVAAHAHMIVSGDRHLLALRAFEAIEIVTAAAAIERLLAS